MHLDEAEEIALPYHPHQSVRREASGPGRETTPPCHGEANPAPFLKNSRRVMVPPWRCDSHRMQHPEGCRKVARGKRSAAPGMFGEKPRALKGRETSLD